MLQVAEPPVLSVLQKRGLGRVGEAAACSPVVVVFALSESLGGLCCLHLTIIIGSAFSKLHSKLLSAHL